MNEQECGQLSLFPEDSRASRSAWPGSEEAVKMTVTSGLKCLELSRKSGPLGLLEKMLLESSTWHSTRCFLTWKDKATKQGRLYFQLAPSMLRTEETEYVSWAGSEKRAIYFIPTPRANNIPTSESAKRKSKSSPGMVDYVRFFPTPKASDCKGSGPRGSKSAERDLQKGNLKGAVMYSTPQARDYRTGQEKRWENPNRSRNLNDQVAQEDCGQLNPAWVEGLMGFPPGWTELEPDGQTEPGRPVSPESQSECRTGPTD